MSRPARSGGPAVAADRPAVARLLSGWRAAGPYLVATLMLLLGYLHYAEGANYSLSPEAYRAWAFPAFRYSDIIWLYLRDGLQARPVPYVDFPLEYPPLTGLLSYLASFAPDLPAYFTAVYLLLSTAVLGTIWTLGRIPGANRWQLALAPAIFFYIGHQWDMAAVFATALALLAFVRGHERWGAVGLVIAVSLKLFAIVFLAAALIDRVRARRWRSAFAVGAIFAAGTLAINGPVALLNLENWSFFFRWNRDRLADSGVWVLLRGTPTETLTTYSLVATVAGGALLTLLALRRGGPFLLPLGSTLLLWWLAVNKTFTTHLIFWVFLPLALLNAPRWLWGAVVAVDLAGFQLGNYLNLYNVPDYQDPALIRKAVENLYDPLQIVRSVVLFAAVGWGVSLLWRPDQASLPSGVPFMPNGREGAADLPNGGGLARRPRFLERTALRWAGDRGRSAPSPGAEDAGLKRRSRLQPDEEREGRGPVGGRAVGGRTDEERPVSEPIGLSMTTSGRRRLAIGTGVALLFAAATVAMTWPYALQLREATVVGFDPLLQIWLSRWVQHALATDPLNLYQANIFYPFELTLAYTDVNIPGAILAAPLAALTGDAILTNSLLVLATFVVAAGGLYAVVVHLTGNRAAGIVAGLAYAFLPWRLVQLWHLNWLQSAWLPWILLALLRTIERPTLGRGAILGLLVAVQILTSFYFAVQIGLLAGAVLLAALLARPDLRRRGVLAPFALAAAIAAVVCVPLYLPYLRVRAEQGLERTIEEAERYKARPASYLTVAPWDRPPPPLDRFGVRPGANEALTTVGQAEHADGHRHAEIVIEDALFPGAVVILGALAGLFWWRRSRWLVAALAAVALVAALLSLGPSLGPNDGSGLPLPYRWLFDHAPFFTAMRVPARLGGLVNLALAVLAGVGIAAGWERLRRRRIAVRAGRAAPIVATALVAAVVLGELAAVPIPLEAVDRSPEIAAPYEWLAKQPPGAVMEFPAESIFADPAGSSVRRHVGLSMYWSTRYWKPLVNGNSGFIPRAYSDLIERFVGAIPRADGSLTGRISHVGPDTAPLLQELGVRYLVFHRSQYRPEDWPAVEAQLGGAEAWIERVGDFGEASVYRLREPLPPPPPAKLLLYAPTLLTEEADWGVWAVARKPGDGPALLSLTRPAILSTAWYDADGRLLWRGSSRLPLPVVLDDSQLRCGLRTCRPATDSTYPDDLPPPEPSWRPTEPGHYVVRLAVGGDRPLTCKIDLDVVDAGRAAELSPDDPRRWAECAETSRVPVNSPGTLPFRSPPPSVTFVGDRLALEATLVARRDEEVRAWFFLAPPGSATPWENPAYQSPIRQKLVRAGEPTAFDWLERVSPETPPGVYGLTVWFHRRAADGTWEHAWGGGYELSPVVVEPDGDLRWAGPIRLIRPGTSPALVVGRSTTLRLDVAGESSERRCAADWNLRAADNRRVVGGHAGSCERPRIDLPATVRPGSYRLEIVATAVEDGDAELSDALSLPVVVRDGEGPGGPR